MVRRSVLYVRLVSLPIALSFGQEFAAWTSALTVVSVVLAAQFLTLTPSGAAIHVGSAMCPVISALGPQVYPDNILELVQNLKARREIRFPQTDKIKESLQKFEDEYPKDDLPWYWLSLAISNPKDESASVPERMMVPVWESDDPEIKLIWEYISRSENKESLLKRYKTANLNGSARELTKMALKTIERRA